MRIKKNKNIENPPNYNRNINVARVIFFCVVAVVMGIYFHREMQAIFSSDALALQAKKHAAAELILASNIEIQNHIIVEEGLELIFKNDCVACHKEKTTAIGPAFRDIAAKYKDDALALKNLSGKVKLGSGGIWGAFPMKPQGNLNPIDIEKMIKYILTLKGGIASAPLPLSEILEIK